MKPAQMLDSLPWRHEPPNASGWWFVHMGDPDAAMLCRVVLSAEWGWPAHWRCCPVELSADVERRAVERCAAIVTAHVEQWVGVDDDAASALRFALDDIRAELRLGAKP